MLDGFTYQTVETGEASIRVAVAGSGPPVLLLHGYPQTHMAWHRIAPVLAREFTVVAPDLRGYGDSTAAIHLSGPDSMAKRALARDQVAVMSHLGFDRYAVVAHDRGARVGYRLALDHPARVKAFASLTVVPTIEVWQRVDMAFAMGAWHWFLFAQAFDLPERFIGADPDDFLDRTLRKMTRYRDRLGPQAVAAYRAAFRRDAVRHAMMNDYRAAATIDLDHDKADRAAGRKLGCPVLVTWEAGRHQSGETLADIWQGWADEVEGGPIDAGHLQAEEAPGEVLALLMPFLNRNT
ncbi:alpha/beta fold hydrolase [Phreatobacter stygius]|uniref:Alpha/beta hydrolase n=1 Tax=Phreatobacter stygius TaxID=1940610 RepID=A0A4D7B1Y0_9HYPH|nr:alpha/beta hydrolase [Phreatobacter stygius]QCI65355.1 alpha/beta hydrolase [Phreatobacter stygius]